MSSSRSREPISVYDDFATTIAPKKCLRNLPPEELKAHKREQNKQACRRRDARKKAKKLGISGPDLLITKTSSDEERKHRHAERERCRRIKLGAAYLERDRLYRSSPKIHEASKQRSRDYYQRNRSAAISAAMKWAAKNPDKVKQYSRISYQRLKLQPEKMERIQTRRLIRDRIRRQTDPQYRMLKALRSSFKQCMKLYAEGRKTQSVRRLVGCSMAEFVSHLESQWEPWMSWRNYGLRGFLPQNGGTAWVIDHKRPCSSFNLQDTNEQQEAFHWSNLRPLEYFENLRKSNKTDW